MFVRSFSKVPPWTHDIPWPHFTVVDFALWTVSTSLRISSFQKKIKENKTSCSALARSHANSWHFTAINENRFYIRQQLFYIYIYICVYIKLPRSWLLFVLFLLVGLFFLPFLISLFVLFLVIFAFPTLTPFFIFLFFTIFLWFLICLVLPGFCRIPLRITALISTCLAPSSPVSLPALPSSPCSIFIISILLTTMPGSSSSMSSSGSWFCSLPLFTCDRNEDMREGSMLERDLPSLFHLRNWTWPQSYPHLLTCSSVIFLILGCTVFFIVDLTGICN